MPMACDGLLPDSQIRVHRAVSIHAQPSMIYRWLCQLKLAPYSYDLLDNFGRRSPPELVHDSEHLEVGQRFMFIFSLTSFVHDEHLTLSGRRVAVTYLVLPKGKLTRLLVRVLFHLPGGHLAVPAAHLLSLGDLVMMRKQLLTLKALAERDTAREAVQAGEDLPKRSA
jgi:hypothetical protein